MNGKKIKLELFEFLIGSNIKVSNSRSFWIWIYILTCESIFCYVHSLQIWNAVVHTSWSGIMLYRWWTCTYLATQIRRSRGLWFGDIRCSQWWKAKAVPFIARSLIAISSVKVFFFSWFTNMFILSTLFYKNYQDFFVVYW